VGGLGWEDSVEGEVDSDHVICGIEWLQAV
jgi:hypothetical protein